MADKSQTSAKHTNNRSENDADQNCDIRCKVNLPLIEKNTERANGVQINNCISVRSNDQRNNARKASTSCLPKGNMAETKEPTANSSGSKKKSSTSHEKRKLTCNNSDNSHKPRSSSSTSRSKTKSSTSEELSEIKAQLKIN